MTTQTQSTQVQADPEALADRMEVLDAQLVLQEKVAASNRNNLLRQKAKLAELIKAAASPNV